MKKLQSFLLNYKFLIINIFIILYFIINFFDGNRGYISLQKKKIEYDKLSNIENLLKIDNKRLKDENNSLSKNIENKKMKNKKFVNGSITKKNLWFVNIGGYEPSSMQEKHQFGLVVASNKLEAKNLAKSKWLLGCKKKHKDDIAALKILISCDDCKPIKMIGNWEIELTLENNHIEETNYPDWYGYKRIDKI